MMRIFFILSMIFMFSCYSLLSDFEEIDELLSYTYYINEGWDAFESVNLSDTLLASQHSEYYELSLAMFDISIQLKGIDLFAMHALDLHMSIMLCVPVLLDVGRML